jgi:hypothetical protein
MFYCHNYLMPVDAVQVGQICLVRNTSVTNEYFIVDDCRQWQPAEQILEEADDLCRMTLEFSEMSLYTDASFNFIKNACIGEKPSQVHNYGRFWKPTFYCTQAANLFNICLHCFSFHVCRKGAPSWIIQLAHYIYGR